MNDDSGLLQVVKGDSGDCQGGVEWLGAIQGVPGRSCATLRSRRRNWCPTVTSPAPLPVCGASAVDPVVFCGPCVFVRVPLQRYGTFADVRSALSLVPGSACMAG